MNAPHYFPDGTYLSALIRDNMGAEELVLTERLIAANPDRFESVWEAVDEARTEWERNARYPNGAWVFPELHPQAGQEFGQHNKNTHPRAS